VSVLNKTPVGADAVAEKGWLAAHKWLILRRISQIGILLAFLVGPWFGLWIVKGNLNYSYTLGVLPLTDPFLFLQTLLTRHVPETLAFVGVGIVIAFYIGVGGRSFCAWTCPVNLVTDLAAWLRRRLNLGGGREPVAPDALLDPGDVPDRRCGHRHHRLGAGQPGVHAAPRPVLRHRLRLGGDPGGVPVRPLRRPPRLVQPPLSGGGLLQPDRPGLDPARAAAGPRGLQRLHGLLCGLPGAPDHQGRRSKGSKGAAPIILDSRCTNCGRCIDVCSKDVFAFGTRFNTTVAPMNGVPHAAPK
jgi:ferredoxin-type protein NapH